MAVKKKNLSDYHPGQIQDAGRFRFALVAAEWNAEITNELLKGAYDTLIRHKVEKDNITIHHVPGSFELPLAASWLAGTCRYDAVICLGCVIQGQTRHFEFISDAVANGIMNAGIRTGIPVIFGVLTTDNMEQAMERAGGKHGNKGTEAAVTALKMAHLKKNI